MAKGKGKETAAKEKSVFRDILDLVFCAGGIYGCYLGYGLVQERILGVDYDGERFTYSLFLVWVQCILNGLFGLVSVLWAGDALYDKVPKARYAQIAFSYIGAMYCSNWALAFVTYPTQALAKSCKLIPVMLMRIVINGKKYKLRDYLCVALITAGISVFSLAKKAKPGEASNSVFGMALLFASLALDGFTGPTQEKIEAEYKPTVGQMMFSMNFFAVIYVGIGLLATGIMWPALAFCQAHPEILLQMLFFSCLSAFGQNFILMTLYRFDSLILTTITTTRKFFTILCSVVWYGHVLVTNQWIGVGMVFFGLAMDTYGKYLSKQERLAASKEGKKDK